MFVQVGQFLSHDLTLAPEAPVEGCCYNPRYLKLFYFLDNFKTCF